VRTTVRLVLALAAVLMSTATALACPLCDTGTGVAVRAGIAEHFALHLGATAAPFVVLFAIVTILQRGWPPWGGGA
jgi:hypothetical protein